MGKLLSLVVKRLMNRVSINGKTYTSNSSITVVNGVVTIDGKTVEEDAKHVMTIKIIEGSIGELQTDKAVVCENVTGNVRAGGSVNADNIGGDVHASGSVSCDDVKGSVQAGGSVSCDRVGGNVDAGGSVSHG